ncbi:MAG: hydroxymethylglutaryl-CoA reductase, degradative [Myxococcales bacterium]|nr:hydroxymethylglutaryl-CoA reductase, degradative [Myxococcales bacterium]
MTRCSRVPGFYKLPVGDRIRRLAEAAGLKAGDVERLTAGDLLDCATADHMIENVVGTYSLPLGIGLNFRINGTDYLVPMAVEEPSVVAAASNAARMVREGGGFTAEADDPIMISQVQLNEVADTEHAKRRIEAHASEIVALADAAQPGLCARGGGTRGIEVRVLARSFADGEREDDGDAVKGMLVVHLHVDCRDAMGANLVNTIAEAVADRLAELSSGEVGLRILSNLADRRCVRVRCRVPVAVLATNGHEGARVAAGIVSASRFAELDPYRAATHNKGIMNGVDAVVLACGNDWRGIEAGAHAFAARSGTYRPLATWRVVDQFLEGRMEIPMALGTVGGATRVHPGARLSLAIVDAESATELGMVIACVGIASNLAALRALASEGIQRGHMSLHARIVAVSAGATGELVERVARELAEVGDVRPERATLILARLIAEGRIKNPQGAC